MKAPPGAVIVAAGYGAGLLTGLLRFPDPAVVIATTLGAAWVLRRSLQSLGCMALIAGVVVGGVTKGRSERSCVAQLPLGEHHFELRTVEPGIAAGRVVVIRRDCAGTVTARWPGSQRIGAGHRLTVRGRWIRRPSRLGQPDGLLLVRQVISVRGAPGPIDSLRTLLTSASAALYGEQAPLVDALTTGRRGALDQAVVQSFAASGLVHLLAISGAHIGVIAGWILLILRASGVSRHRAAVLAVTSAWCYTAFIGFPPSAVRASALLAWLAWTRWRQRNVQPGALLGASGLLLLLIDPYAIGSVGAWLSILALLGVSVATRWSDRALGTSTLVRSLSGSVGATLHTAPVTAFAFGQVAPIGVLLNLTALPLMAIALPAVILSLLLWSILPVVGAAFASSSGLLLTALATVARMGASAPGAATIAAPGWQTTWPWIAALGAAHRIIAGPSTRSEALRRCGWGVTTLLWTLMIPTSGAGATLGNGRLALLFMDVGQGDAALIRTPSGHWVAVDAGPVDQRGHDAGQRVLLPFLRREGAASLDAMVLSHAHRDHVGGGRSLVDAIRLGAVVEPGELFADSSYDDWLTALGEHGVRWHPARAGTIWTIDGVEFRVLHPPAPWPRQGEDLNEDSVVLLVSWGKFRALLMGDAGFVAESSLAGTLPQVDVLKVGHHGSRWASGAAFLAEIHPTVGIVSVGVNRYGHPSPEALGRLAAAGVRVWRTDREGTTSVVTDGNTFTVQGGSGSATYAARARRGPRRRRARSNQGHDAGALHSRTGAGSPGRHG